jgi:hypothetical protein
VKAFAVLGRTEVNGFLRAHREPSDGHFGCHVGTAFQQTDGNHGCGKVGVSVVALHDSDCLVVSIQSVGSTDTLSSGLVVVSTSAIVAID